MWVITSTVPDADVVYHHDEAFLRQHGTERQVGAARERSLETTPSERSQLKPGDENEWNNPANHR